MGAPLEEEGVGQAGEVDVGRVPPLVRGQNPGHLHYDEAGLYGGLPAVVDGLVPGRAGELEGDDDADAALVVREGLLRLDPPTPGQVDRLK